MKKFMQTSAVAKELAARKGERDSMLMGLNSTAGSDDVDDDPAGSLAYGHMRIRKDGTVMTDSEIRDLRQRQGYCLTCPGDPIKLFAVKRSKMNPLYQKKEAIEISNQSSNGVCLKCTSGNPSSVRRSSFGAPSSGGSKPNADMLPGTLLSLRNDPYFKQMRKVSSFGANGIGETSGILSPLGTVGVSMNSGIGSSGSDQSPDLRVPLSLKNGTLKRRDTSPKMGRSNSGDIAKVTRSLTPTRLHAMRRSNSDDSFVSTGVVGGAVRGLPPTIYSLQRSKSSDFDSSMNFDIPISQDRRRRSIQSSHSSGSDSPSQLLETERASQGDESDAGETKVPTWKEIADFAMKAKREKEASDISNRGAIQEMRLKSVDSDGFFNVVDEMSIASENEFRNSFANLDSSAVVEETKGNPLLSKHNRDDSDVQDTELQFISSPEPKTADTKFAYNETATPFTNDESSAPGRASPEKSLNQRLPMTVANEKSFDEQDLLHNTLLRFMRMSEARFDDLERQMATILQQQTHVLQQHGAILEILSNLRPVNPAGNTHPIAASTVPPRLLDIVQGTEPSQTKKLKEKSKSKLASPSTKTKDVSSPTAKHEKSIVPVEPDPDRLALEHHGSGVALASVSTGDGPAVGAYEDYVVQLGGSVDSNVVEDPTVDDDTVIASNPPSLSTSPPTGTSPTTITPIATTSGSSRHGSGESRRSSSTRKSIVEASSGGVIHANGGSVPPSKALRRRSSQRRLISTERSQRRLLSLSPGRRSARESRAYSADNEEMMTVAMLGSLRVETTPKRENRADIATDEQLTMMVMHGNTTTAPPDSAQGPNGVEVKSRRGSSRRQRVDGDEPSSSRNGSNEIKQDKKKEKRKLKKKSSASRRADFTTDEEDDNNS